MSIIQSLDFGTIAIVFFSLVISITLHEAMHAFTSHWLGDDTAHREGRISLNPFRHVDPFATILLPLITLIIFKVPLLAAKPVPFNPNRVKFDEFGAALVGISGPLTNLFLAFSAAGFINLFFSSMSEGLLNVLLIFMLVNVGLFVFNMMPIPPLDGSRLVYAFAPEPVQRFMASLEQFGVLIVFALVLMVPAYFDIIRNLNRSIIDFLIIV
ncbi:MAG: site-2 protease family protein [Candidatus Saccharimonadales bacterium]